MIRAVERSVGRAMDKLEAEGLADNTIIVFSYDNSGAGLSRPAGGERALPQLEDPPGRAASTRGGHAGDWKLQVNER